MSLVFFLPLYLSRNLADRWDTTVDFTADFLHSSRFSAFRSMLFHFLIDYVISVRDAQEFAETAHLQCLYPSFNVCCCGPRFTCIQQYGHDQATHQSDLGADGDVLGFFVFCFFFKWLLVWSLQQWSRLLWRVLLDRITHPALQLPDI